MPKMKVKKGRSQKWCTCSYCTLEDTPGKTLSYEQYRYHQRRAKSEAAVRKHEANQARLMARLTQEWELSRTRTAQADETLEPLDFTPNEMDTQAGPSSHREAQFESADGHARNENEDGQDLETDYHTDAVLHTSRRSLTPNEVEGTDSDGEVFILQPFVHQRREEESVEAASHSGVLDSSMTVARDDDDQVLGPVPNLNVDADEERT